MITTVLATLVTVLNMGAHLHCDSMTNTYLAMELCRTCLSYDATEENMYYHVLDLDERIYDEDIYIEDVTTNDLPIIYAEEFIDIYGDLADNDNDCKFYVYKTIYGTKLAERVKNVIETVK